MSAGTGPGEPWRQPPGGAGPERTRVERVRVERVRVERVRVERSRPSAAAAVSRRPVPSRAPSPAVTSTYERDLRRTQLRWSLATLVAVAGPLLALPAAFALLPQLALLPVLGVPLGWLVLAAGVYPLVWLGGRWYRSGAERTERDYAELVGERVGQPARQPAGQRARQTARRRSGGPGPDAPRPDPGAGVHDHGGGGGGGESGGG